MARGTEQSSQQPYSDALRAAEKQAAAALRDFQSGKGSQGWLDLKSAAVQEIADRQAAATE